MVPFLFSGEKHVAILLELELNARALSEQQQAGTSVLALLRCAAAGASEQTSRGWLVPASYCAPQVAPVEITGGLVPAVVRVWKSAAWGMYLSVVDWSLLSMVLVWWIG